MFVHPDLSSKLISAGMPDESTEFAEPQPGGMLFRLPAELRIAIYELVVVRTCKELSVDPTIIDLRIIRDHGYSEVEAAQPPLTRTCSAIRKETLPIFYKAHDFSINTSTQSEEATTRQWLRGLGESGRGRIGEAIMYDKYWARCERRMLKSEVMRVLWLWELDGARLSQKRIIDREQYYVFDLRKLKLP